MNEELTKLLARLNAIQAKVFDCTITRADKAEFRELSRLIPPMGYKLSRRKVKDGTRHIATVWSVKPVASLGRKYSAGRWERDEHEKNCNIECTTRAIYFVLEHVVPYQTIRETQNERARKRYGIGRCRGWNTEQVWGALLHEWGFTKLYLPRPMRSGILAERLANVDARVAIHSSHHLAACYRGAVVDDWDSRRKPVDYIFVPNGRLGEVRYALGV